MSATLAPDVDALYGVWPLLGPCCHNPRREAGVDWEVCSAPGVVSPGPRDALGRAEPEMPSGDVHPLTLTAWDQPRELAMASIAATKLARGRDQGAVRFAGCSCIFRSCDGGRCHFFS
jgi:hypothetical protein